MFFKKDFDYYNKFSMVTSMKFEEEIEASEEISCVIVNGEKIPVDNVEFLNVEEDVYGRDLMTFVYNGETRQSCIVKQYR